MTRLTKFIRNVHFIRFPGCARRSDNNVSYFDVSGKRTSFLAAMFREMSGSSFLVSECSQYVLQSLFDLIALLKN